MIDARKQFKNEDDFIKALSNITLFSQEELIEVCKDKSAAWGLFMKKVSNTAVIIFAAHIFPKYVKHILRKFIRNGYQRIQFRAELVRLSKYDEKGKFLQHLPEAAYADAF